VSLLHNTATHRHVVCEQHPCSGSFCFRSSKGAETDLAADDPLPPIIYCIIGFSPRRCYHTPGRYPGHGRLVGEPLGVRGSGGRSRNLTVSPEWHTLTSAFSSLIVLLRSSRGEHPFGRLRLRQGAAKGNLVTTSPSSRWEGLTNFSATVSVTAGCRQSKRFTSTSNR
jgi:hypothetical protein